MRLKETSGISFSGKGQLVGTLKKYSEETARKMLPQIRKVFGNVTDEFVSKKNLKALGLLNKNDELVNAFEKVTVKEGLGKFDDRLLQNADLVILEGGELQAPLIAKNVIIRGGSHQEIKAANVKIHGIDSPQSNQTIITAKKLYAKNAEINSRIITNKSEIEASSLNNFVYSRKTIFKKGLSIIKGWVKAAETIINEKTKLKIEKNPINSLKNPAPTIIQLPEGRVSLATTFEPGLSTRSIKGESRILPDMNKIIEHRQISNVPCEEIHNHAKAS